MRIIGSVSTLDKDENGEYLDTSYMGGTIVMLNEKETKLLGLLQAAWSGEIIHGPTRYSNPQDEDVSDAFKAIATFVDAKFAINKFRGMVDRLDSVLIEGK